MSTPGLDLPWNGTLAPLTRWSVLLASRCLTWQPGSLCAITNRNSLIRFSSSNRKGGRPQRAVVSARSLRFHSHYGTTVFSLDSLGRRVSGPSGRLRGGAWLVRVFGAESSDLSEGPIGSSLTPEGRSPIGVDQTPSDLPRMQIGPHNFSCGVRQRIPVYNRGL